MKTLFFTLLTVILFSGFSNAQKIDMNRPFQNDIKIQGSNVKVTEDYAKTLLESTLKTQGRPAILTIFKIMRDIDQKTKKEYYLLVGINKEGTVKIGIPLHPATTVGAFLLMPSGPKVTCEGCTKGCNPRQFGSDWECTDCQFGSGGLGCKKTVTVGG